MDILALVLLVAMSAAAGLALSKDLWLTLRFVIAVVLCYLAGGIWLAAFPYVIVYLAFVLCLIDAGFVRQKTGFESEENVDLSPLDLKPTYH